MGAGPCPTCLPQPAATITAPLSTPESKKTPFLWGAGQIAVACFLVVPLALHRSLFGGINWAYSTGQFIGMLLIPTLIAYFAAGRKGNWRAFGNWFLVLAVVFAGFSRIGEAANRETSEQQIGRIMREALGAQQPNSLADSDEDTLRTIFKDFFATAGKVQAGYEDVHLEATYQPDSFASEASMRAEIEQLDKLLAVNQSAGQMFTTFPEFAEKRLAEHGVDAERRTQYKEVMRKSMTSSGASAFDFIAKEKAWAGSTRALYAMALTRQDVIHVQDGKVRIADNGVLTEFNALWKTSAEAQQAMEQAREAKDKMVQTNSAKFGMKPEEMREKMKQ
jgi:hypothetical protein